MRERVGCLNRKLLSPNTVRQPGPRAAGQSTVDALSTGRFGKGMLRTSSSTSQEATQTDTVGQWIIDCSESQTHPKHQLSLLSFVWWSLVGEGWWSGVRRWQSLHSPWRPWCVWSPLSWGRDGIFPLGTKAHTTMHLGLFLDLQNEVFFFPQKGKDLAQGSTEPQPHTDLLCRASIPLTLQLISSFSLKLCKGLQLLKGKGLTPSWLKYWR